MGRLFWKFFFSFWLAVLLAGIGVGSAVWWRHREQLNARQLTEMHIDRHADAWVSAAANVLRHGGIDALSQYLSELGEPHNPPVYAVDDTDRELLRREVSAETLQHARALYLRAAFPKAIQLIQAANGHSYLLFAALPEHGFHPPHEQDVQRGIPPGPPPHAGHGEFGPIEFGGKPPGVTHPRPHEPPSPWLPITTGLIASLLFSMALAWYFATPIRGLRQAFAAVAEGKLQTRVGRSLGKRRDELVDLGLAFDHMAEQIENLVDAQQRLLHDVSHELRSPLARMQVAIGLAQQQPDKIAASLERIERESQRINELVGELLMLSRLEAGVCDDACIDADVGCLLKDIAEDARFEAESKGISLTYRSVADELYGSIRAELLLRAVENVLRNAVQHCRADGEVEMIVDYQPSLQCLKITVNDQGPGVAEADLQAIFMPFFRSGKRVRPDSVGLGLTIAQRSVSALGGNVSARNRPTGGLQVAIELPFTATMASGVI
ncbi:ATP-binding protein [Methylomonas sp. HYX-M1]|uniref:ATP-binding protein n=1 Tax=Methylomonas sp. HYX-M1 TaxID=3139307 RepID=UPI00345C545C